MVLLLLLTTLALAEHSFAGKEIRQVNEALEFYFNGEWRPVCANNWNEKNTKVACRHLTGSGEGSFAEIGVQVVNDKYWFNFIECSGEEAKLSHCKSKNMNHSGSGNAKLGVYLTCAEHKNSGVRRLEGYGYGESPRTTASPKVCSDRAGRIRQRNHEHTYHDIKDGKKVEVTQTLKYLEIECGPGTGNFIPVCDMNWLPRNNQVVCRALNPNCKGECRHYQVGLVKIHKQHNFYTGRLFCTGEEANLTTCPADGKFTYCKECMGVQVECDCPSPCRKPGEECKNSFNINGQTYKGCKTIDGFGKKPVCEIETGGSGGGYGYGPPPKTPKKVRTCKACPTPQPTKQPTMSPTKRPTKSPTKAPTVCHPKTTDGSPCNLPFRYEGKTYDHCVIINKLGKTPMCPAKKEGSYGGPEMRECVPCAKCRPRGEPCLKRWSHNDKVYSTCTKLGDYGPAKVCRVAGKSSGGGYGYGNPSPGKIYKCQACPTPNPTPPPTSSPTTKPTKPPTGSPTKMPTLPPCVDKRTDGGKCFNPCDAKVIRFSETSKTVTTYECDKPAEEGGGKAACVPCAPCRPLGPDTKAIPCEKTFEYDGKTYKSGAIIPHKYGLEPVCGVKVIDKDGKVVPDEDGKKVRVVRVMPACPAALVEHTKTPTISPSKPPTSSPTKAPTQEPTKTPTKSPTKPPTKVPTRQPTQLCRVVALAVVPTRGTGIGVGVGEKCTDEFDGHYKKRGAGANTKWIEETKKLNLIFDHSINEWVVRLSGGKSLVLAGLGAGRLDGEQVKEALLEQAKIGQQVCRVALICIWPTKPPSQAPTPTKRPTELPTKAPTKTPTKTPTKPPTKTPTTSTPTQSPSNQPTPSPTKVPTKSPTKTPTKPPTNPPTKTPTVSPTKPPTKKPTSSPIRPQEPCGKMMVEKCCDVFNGGYVRDETNILKYNHPSGAVVKWLPKKNEWGIFTKAGKEIALTGLHLKQLGDKTMRAIVPIMCPAGSKPKNPKCLIHCKETENPTPSPTTPPTTSPTTPPTSSPSEVPTKSPTKSPTKNPTKSPTKEPTKSPTKEPTTLPPTKPPTLSPTTKEPTKVPTRPPSKSPTRTPTVKPPCPVCKRICILDSPFGKGLYEKRKRPNGDDEWFSKETGATFYYSRDRTHQEYVIKPSKGDLLLLDGLRNEHLNLKKQTDRVRLEKVKYGGKRYNVILTCCDTPDPTKSPTISPTRPPTTKKPTSPPTPPPCNCDDVDMIFVIDYLSCEMTWRLQIETVIKIIRDYSPKGFRLAVIIHDHRVRVWSRFKSVCVDRTNVNDIVDKLRELQKLTPPDLKGRSCHADLGIAKAVDLFRNESSFNRQKLLFLMTGSAPNYKHSCCEHKLSIQRLKIRVVLFALERSNLLKSEKWSCLLPGELNCSVTSKITNSCKGGYGYGGHGEITKTITNKYYFTYEATLSYEMWGIFKTLICNTDECKRRCTPWSDWTHCCKATGKSRRFRQCEGGYGSEKEAQVRQCARIPNLFVDVCPIDCKITNQFNQCLVNCPRPKERGKFSEDLCGFIGSGCATKICYKKWPLETYQTTCKAKYTFEQTGYKETSFHTSSSVIRTVNTGGIGKISHAGVTGKHILFSVGAVLLIAGIYYRRKQNASGAHQYLAIPDEEENTA